MPEAPILWIGAFVLLVRALLRDGGADPLSVSTPCAAYPRRSRSPAGLSFLWERSLVWPKALVSKTSIAGSNPAASANRQKRKTEILKIEKLVERPCGRSRVAAPVTPRGWGAGPGGTPALGTPRRGAWPLVPCYSLVQAASFPGFS